MARASGLDREDDRVGVETALRELSPARDVHTVMIVALTLALFLQARTVEEDACSLFLRYLARHQRPDGSWGERPETCTCPEERKIVPCDNEKVEPLLLALGDEDPEKRETAQKELRALGESALPRLRAAADDPDPEVRGRCAALCRKFDLVAKGGSDAELTGLALLTFLGAGYSHLSKDVYDGICFGDVVKKELRWLVARQKEAGAFDAKDPAAEAVAALALSEAYGFTGSALFKEEAQRGIDRIALKRMDETRGLIWKGMALKSAELGDLTLEKETAKANFEALQARQGDLAIAGNTVILIFVNKNKNDPWLPAIGALDPASLEPETLYFATLAAFQFDGPTGPLWRVRNEWNKSRLVPAQNVAKDRCERGSWDGRGLRGRLQATALAGLILEIYHR